MYLALARAHRVEGKKDTGPEQRLWSLPGPRQMVFFMLLEDVYCALSSVFRDKELSLYSGYLKPKSGKHGPRVLCLRDSCLVPLLRV